MNTKTIIDNAWWTLSRLCDQHGEAQRWLADCHRVALEQERQHRAMGKRFTNGSAAYRGSADLAARYFCCKAVAEGPPKGKLTWARVQSYREDYRLGYAIRELLGRKLPPEIMAVLQVDYSEHIAVHS